MTSYILICQNRLPRKSEWNKKLELDDTNIINNELKNWSSKQKEMAQSCLHVKQLSPHTSSILVLCASVSIKNAAVLFYSTEPVPDGSYIQGTSLWIQCDNQSVLVGSDPVVCGNDGTWSPIPPTCISEL